MADRCRRCGTRVTWVTTFIGRRMPVESHPGGNLRLHRGKSGTNAINANDSLGTHRLHQCKGDPPAGDHR